MKARIISIFGVGFCMPYAADSLPKKEASPTIKERLTKDTIQGTLMNIEGEYYFIKDDAGKERKIHVDRSTN